MKKFLLVLSVTIFVLSLLFTIMSISGIDVEAYFNWVNIIGFGIFITFPPCITILNKNKLEFTNQQKGTIIILLLFAGYCFLNALFNITPIEKNGIYYLVNHGNSHIITKSEYIKTRKENFLRESSVWLLFYGISSIIYYLYIKKEHLSTTNTGIFKLSNPTSVENEVVNNKFKITLNPVSDRFKLELSNEITNTKIIEVKLIDALGKVILNNIENIDNIDISNLLNGNYFIQIKYLDNEIKTEMLKLVKE